MRFGVALLTGISLIAQDAASSDPKQRAKAAREAVKAGSQGISRIEPLLADPETSVRLEAVKSIVEIGSQYSIAPLIKSLGDEDPEVQIRATDGLVNFYLPGYVKSGLSGTLSRSGNAIKGKFGIDIDEDVIEEWIEVRPEVITGIGKLLTNSPDLLVRSNAARAIGVLRGKGAMEALTAALRSKDTRLMFESLIAMQKIRDPKSGPRVSFLFRDPEERVAVAALETAGLVRSTEVLPDIQTAYARAATPKVRKAALGALAMLGDPQSRALFNQGLTDKDEGIRSAAAEGLGRAKNPEDISALQRCFDEERKMPPRLACAFGLVNHGRTESGETSALGYLINTLNSKAWRGVAEGYLIELARAKTVRTGLENSAAGASKDEKIQLARILGVSGDKDSVVVLERMVRDPEPDVMQEGVRALRNLRARLP